MGCSGRVKAEDIRPEQKWEFISLNDFHSTSCLKPFAYAYLWVSLFISQAVYIVDIFTASNLLLYDKWSSEFKPPIPIDISKWIFTGCIIASWVNLAFEHMRAFRVIKRGAVAESYLDSLAARLQSTRFGSGKGWKRFLVFAELTKSKKGAEYVALFTYFSFQSWIRIIFCQGPRQVINALTLYSVLKLQFDPTQKDISLSLMTFFENISILADKEEHQALILSGMVFTLCIWILGALSLLLAVLFYILFLWHYIPNADGGLSGYCERKINTRLAQIVSVKVNRAIEEEERRRLKADTKAIAKGEQHQIRQATLPTIFDPTSNEKLSTTPTRSNHTSIFIQSDRPGSRATKNFPFQPYGATASLLNNASDMGYARSGSPAPSINPGIYGFAPPSRPGTSNSIRSFPPEHNGFIPPPRPGTSNSTRSFAPEHNGFIPPPRPGTSNSIRSFAPEHNGFIPPPRPGTSNSIRSFASEPNGFIPPSHPGTSNSMWSFDSGSTGFIPTSHPGTTNGIRSFAPESTGFPPPLRPGTSNSMRSYLGPPQIPPNSSSNRSFTPGRTSHTQSTFGFNQGLETYVQPLPRLVEEPSIHASNIDRGSPIGRFLGVSSDLQNIQVQNDFGETNSTSRLDTENFVPPFVPKTAQNLASPGIQSPSFGVQHFSERNQI
ncbi:hypothetical protein K3495_g10380 [Podosphaera aphanis]|nr:hypothetical protein K3495_g10380 [Podosphaera aphanis]